ncbi:MAG: hypothetical protein KAV00_12095 [Phycisphaerae bacterium]|nr:hypothetical protein [Phycisphaerae bacterium]
MCIVFEGELFAPDDIRRQLEKDGHIFRSDCDAEVALHAFEQYGTEGIARLAGAYVGVIYDFKSRTCHLFTDRLGLRGCYYYVAPSGAFIFASEMKAIAAVRDSSGTVDDQAVAEFLNRGYPFFERTFFKDVKYLLHGTVLSFKDGRLSRDQYWDMPRLKPDANWKFEDAVHEGADLLVQAVGRQFRQQGEIGAFLSGGLDSRAIVAAASATGHRIPTFSLGCRRNTEQKLASRVTERLGLENHQLEIPPDFLVRFAEIGSWYTDAMVPCTQLYWLPQLGHIAERVQSLMSGYLGGVLYGGSYGLYGTSSYQGMRSNELLPTSVHGNLIAQRLVSEFSPFLEIALTPSSFDTFRPLFQESSREVALATGDRGFGNELVRMRLHTDERRLTAVTNGIILGVFADAKYPFGDYDLLDFFGRLPVKWRFGALVYKAILCKAFPELIKIPCISANTQHVPSTLDSNPSLLQIRWKKMKRDARFLLGRLTGGRLSLPDRGTYVHYNHWYRTVPSLRKWIESILLDDRTLDRGYYERAGIERLLHLEMTRGYLFSALATLVAFEYWNRFFVDKQLPNKHSESVSGK